MHTMRVKWRHQLFIVMAQAYLVSSSFQQAQIVRNFQVIPEPSASKVPDALDEKLTDFRSRCPSNVRCYCLCDHQRNSAQVHV